MKEKWIVRCLFHRTITHRVIVHGRPLWYILSFLQQGSIYFDEKSWFISSCQNGNGIGGPGPDKWISNKLTAKQCANAVRLKYPTANGFTSSNPCKICKCWAVFGMTGWSRNDWSINNRKSCKFSDRKGKHISEIMCIMRPMWDHCARYQNSLRWNSPEMMHFRHEKKILLANIML